MMLVLAPCSAEEQQRLNIGEVISEQAALARGTSALPDGNGLPSGSGTAANGQNLYAVQCAACHGDQGEGRPGFAALVGGRGSLASDTPTLTVGSYWPTATTVFDYVWRAMPYDKPGSLTSDEAYALTAWILSANGIIKETQRLDARTLPRVTMPNADGFIIDAAPSK
jgi:cytochrome c